MGKEDARKRSQKTAFYTIDKIGEHLGLSEEIKEKAKSLYAEAQEKKLISSRGLKTTTAAVISIAAVMLDEEIDPQKIVQESGSSNVSFKNEYDDLIKGLFQK